MKLPTYSYKLLTLLLSPLLLSVGGSSSNNSTAQHYEFTIHNVAAHEARSAKMMR